MIYVVWEGMVGIPTQEFDQRTFDRRLLMRRRGAALRLYDTNALAVSALWDIWHQDRTVVLVSYLPHDLKATLADRLDREGIPHLKLLFSTPRTMARTVAIHQEIRCIVDADPLHRLLYGPQGLCLPARSAQLMARIDT
ncbi:hypothetical protein ABZ543_12880 [Streptomyces roseifaciens]